MLGDPNSSANSNKTNKTLFPTRVPLNRSYKQSPKVKLKIDASGTPGSPSLNDSSNDTPLDIELPLTFSNLRPVTRTDRHVQKGDLCRGRVVELLPEGVVVNIGTKTEGLITATEFEKSSDLPKLGQEIDVIFQGGDKASDYDSFSHQNARFLSLWEDIEQAHLGSESMSARVVSEVPGGLNVDIGLSAFLPRHEIDLQPPSKIEMLVGSELPVRVIKLSRTKGRIVVSRKVLLKEEICRQKAKLLSTINLGTIVSGVVKNATSYGVFVNLGVIDAFLHITDLSHGRVAHPLDVVKIGTSISAKVIKFNPNREEISLSLKAMEPDPWENLEDRYKVGNHVGGKVTHTTSFGVFVELEKNLEGLLHVSEISWSKHSRHEAKKIKVGQSIECAISNIDVSKRRLFLSCKALTPDPWESAAQTYKTGTIVEGKVLSVTSYGAFVELEKGIEGLVHITDLTRDPQVQHPKEILKSGDRVQVVVMHVEKNNKRLSLGMKQLEPDPWDKFSALHSVGDLIEARVLRRTNSGVFVEPTPGLETFCHWKDLRGHTKQKGKNGLKIGQIHNFQILDLNDLEQRLHLGHQGLIQGANKKETLNPRVVEK